MLEAEAARGVVLYFESRGQQVLEAEAKGRGAVFEIVASKIGRDRALGIEDGGRVSVRTAPARRVEGRVVAALVSCNRLGRARDASQGREGRERGQLRAGIGEREGRGQGGPQRLRRRCDALLVRRIECSTRMLGSNRRG